jgi:hypothetical protein
MQLFFAVPNQSHKQTLLLFTHRPRSPLPAQTPHSHINRHFESRTSLGSSITTAPNSARLHPHTPTTYIENKHYTDFRTKHIVRKVLLLNLPSNLPLISFRRLFILFVACFKSVDTECKCTYMNMFDFLLFSLHFYMLFLLLSLYPARTLCTKSILALQHRTAAIAEHFVRTRIVLILAELHLFRVTRQMYFAVLPSFVQAKTLVQCYDYAFDHFSLFLLIYFHSLGVSCVNYFEFF